jgi:16S rRNA (cytosine967-C5)-methyltransferase
VAPSSFACPRSPPCSALVVSADTLVDGNDLQLWSHRHATDGFYAAVWERR